MSLEEFDICILNYQSNNIKNIVNNLNKKIKSDDNTTGTFLPKQLDKDNFIVMLKDKISYEISSFIWYAFYPNDIFIKILHVNFSYTFNKFRFKGLNKSLTLELEKIGRNNKIQYITLTPFENSPIKKILIKLGYTSQINYFYKKIF